MSYNDPTNPSTNAIPPPPKRYQRPPPLPKLPLPPVSDIPYNKLNPPTPLDSNTSKHYFRMFMERNRVTEQEYKELLREDEEFVYVHHPIRKVNLPGPAELLKITEPTPKRSSRKKHKTTERNAQTVTGAQQSGKPPLPAKLLATGGPSRRVTRKVNRVTRAVPIAPTPTVAVPSVAITVAAAAGPSAESALHGAQTSSFTGAAADSGIRNTDADGSAATLSVAAAASTIVNFANTNSPAKDGDKQDVVMTDNADQIEKTDKSD